MKVTAQVKGLKSLESKHIIVRNLSRILDIRILDINVESRTVSLIYDSILAFEKAKNEFDQNPGELFYVVAMADKRVAPKEVEKWNTKYCPSIALTTNFTYSLTV